MQEASISERFPDGESYEDVRVRMIDFLQFLKEKYE
jgi:broad specificity phosphatase PhoE